MRGAHCHFEPEPPLPLVPRAKQNGFVRKIAREQGGAEEKGTQGKEEREKRGAGELWHGCGWIIN